MERIYVIPKVQEHIRLLAVHEQPTYGYMISKQVDDRIYALHPYPIIRGNTYIPGSKEVVDTLSTVGKYLAIPFSVGDYYAYVIQKITDGRFAHWKMEGGQLISDGSIDAVVDSPPHTITDMIHKLQTNLHHATCTAPYYKAVRS